MFLNAAILISTVACGALLLYRPLATSPLWRATITPLASIVGSGFLVLGPILDVLYGAFAPLAMAALCLVAWLFGAAIRFNMRRIEHDRRRPALVERVLEPAASATLAFAYVISVAYYLNLFGAFGISLTTVDDAYHARMLTTAVFAIILFTGWFRGFSALERLEQISVGLKLAIIAGLLCGLTVYFAQRASTGNLVWNPMTVTGWAAATPLLGLIVTVQGFETSRYLGEAYDTDTRLRSMKLAQVVSSAIYLIYIVLLAYVFVPDQLALEETAIIELMEIVAPILPLLLVAAALSAQFSAAVADTNGSGGLFSEISGERITPRAAYAILVAIGLFLTWSADVFEIISYASRAFALYYALQALIAARTAWEMRFGSRAAAFVALAVLGFVIVFFGEPVE